jgi:hypothetical protein
VTGNSLTGTTLSLRDWPRGAEFTMYNIKVTGNTFHQTAIYTEGGTWNASSPSTKLIVINQNTYQGGVSFNWGAVTYTTLADVRAKLGLELAGKAI